MRFIGNKEKLLDTIYRTVVDTGIKDGSFCDFFAGTGSVGRFFKQKGFKVISNDLLYFSYVLQKAYIINNTDPKFTKILKKINGELSSPFDFIRNYLNGIKPVKGLIYNNYTEEGTRGKKFVRKYFTGENAKKIDAIRLKIEEWKKDKLITENEYYILLADLIESVPFYANISGVYAAFLKKYDPRALKKFQLRKIPIFLSNKKHAVHNMNGMEMIKKINVDVLYIDPPYNSRQYGGNYHLLETIAKYDNPTIKGVSGMRNYDNQKSEFCNAKTALVALKKIAHYAKYKYLILSYNSEGIMPQEEIIRVLQDYGSVELNEVDYLRFKSNNNGDSKHKKHIKEQLYVLERK